VRVLRGGHGHIAPLDRGVGAAFDEVKARHRRQPHDLVQRKYLGRLDHAVDHEAVFGGVNVPPALVVPLEVQTTGRDDAKQRLKGRKRHRGLRGLCQARALATLHIRFILGWLAIASIRCDALPQSLAVLRQIQDIGITAFGGNRVALGHGTVKSRARGGGRKGVSDEVAAATLGLGNHLADAIPTQKTLGRLAQAPRYGSLLIHTDSSNGETDVIYIRTR